MWGVGRDLKVDSMAMTWRGQLATGGQRGAARGGYDPPHLRRIEDDGANEAVELPPSEPLQQRVRLAQFVRPPRSARRTFALALRRTFALPLRRRRHRDEGKKCVGELHEAVQIDVGDWAAAQGWRERAAAGCEDAKVRIGEQKRIKKHQ